jgi:pimeloyl-ACP methyl ester carboxylesterase
MLISMRIGWYSTLAAILVLGPAMAQSQTGPELAPGAATFNVFLRSTPVGFQQTDVRRSAAGWIIESRGDLSQPLDIRNQSFRIEYDAELRPLSLRVAAVRGNLPFSLVTTFEAGTAASELEEGGQRSTFDTVPPPDAVVLLNYFFGGYEALARRLGDAGAGDDIPVYVAPRTLTRARVEQVRRQQMETRAGDVIDARVYSISFLYADGPVAAEVWVDARHRLARVSIPQVAVDVVRDDIGAVGTRVRALTHAGDEAVSVRSEGFGLAATVTVPVDRSPPADGWPAVLLVSGPGAPDRDGTFSGVPVFGHLAAALADAGFLVARYDRRGIGRSGGRPESAGVEEYAEDARMMVRYLDDRDDVDRERITVVGHAEGGWPAMLVAARERRADNLVLIGVPGTSGADLVLEQQTAILDRLNASDRERTEKIRLQRQIVDAVRDEGSWNDVPAAMREQADTHWFRSFLDFDAADTLRRTRQPLLILHGSRDRHVGAHHAGRLAEHARRRRRGAPSAQQITLEGLDHRLLAAGSDETTADPDPRARSISRSVVDALTTWLNQRRNNR